MLGLKAFWYFTTFLVNNLLFHTVFFLICSNIFPKYKLYLFQKLFNNKDYYFFEFEFIKYFCFYLHSVITFFSSEIKWSKRPSGPASSISLTEVKHGCVWSETGWASFQMNDQNSSLRHPSEGTLN